MLLEILGFLNFWILNYFYKYIQYSLEFHWSFIIFHNCDGTVTVWLFDSKRRNISACFLMEMCFSSHQVIMNCNVLPAFMALMGHEKETVVKETCWAVSNITAGNKIQIQVGRWDIFEQKVLKHNKFMRTIFMLFNVQEILNLSWKVNNFNVIKKFVLKCLKI